MISGNSGLGVSCSNITLEETWAQGSCGPIYHQPVSRRKLSICSLPVSSVCVKSSNANLGLFVVPIPGKIWRNERAGSQQNKQFGGFA